MVKRYDAVTDEQFVADDRWCNLENMREEYIRLREHHLVETKELLDELRYQVMVVRRMAQLMTDAGLRISYSDPRRLLENMTRLAQTLLSCDNSVCDECGHSHDSHDVDHELDIFCHDDDGKCTCGTRVGR